MEEKNLAEAKNFLWRKSGNEEEEALLTTVP